MDIDPGSVLTNRGLNGYGYGQHGNSGYDGSVVNSNVVANRDIGVLGAITGASRDQALSNQIMHGDTSLATAMGNSTSLISDRIAATSIDAKFANVSDQFASSERLAFANAQASERLSYANQAGTERTLTAMQIEAARCCCETKAGLAAIDAKLDAAATTALAVSAAKNEAVLAQLLADRGHHWGK